MELGDFATDLIDPAPNNREVTPSDVEPLLPSMRADGQRVPGVIYPDGNGRLLCAAGNRRLLACRILGLRFKAFKLAAAPTAAELRKLRLTENVLRKAMTPREIATDLNGYIAETGCTQAEAAELFGFSPGKVSKLLSLLLLPDEVQQMIDAGKLGQDIGRIISGLPEGVQVEFAKQAVAAQWKRDRAEREAHKLKGKKVKREKPRRIELAGAQIVFPASQPWDWWKALVAKLSKVIANGEKSQLAPDDAIPLSLKTA